jgi:3-hydroxy-D-aspartate aldolase
LRLGNDQSVERIMMVLRQAAGVFGVSSRHGQDLEAQSQDRGDNRPIEAQFSDRPLDGDFPNRRGADDNLARLVAHRGEHGRLGISGATNRLAIGDKVRLIPGHYGPTVNLYDWYVCTRGHRIEQLWPITAGGTVH